jgi:hypothetical protein
MKNAYLHLAGALVLLIAVISAYLFWYHELSAKRAEAAAESATLATSQANAALASEASAQLSSLGADAAAVNAYFIDAADVVPFLETLQDTGSRLGSSIDVQSVTAKSDGRPHLDLSLTISGPFSAVARTVGAIEFAPYDITVTSLSMTAASDDAGGWNAVMAFSVGTASAASGAALPSASAPAAHASASSTASHAGPAFTSVPSSQTP